MLEVTTESEVCKSEAINVHSHVYSRMNLRRGEIVSLEGAASRLANDDIFLAETKVATIGGVGVWFTPLQNFPCD